ncbi:FeFe-hydrogenase_assembly protein HydE [Hexamita inflata]|uniref:FeFe-hydrogenase assembly protein HydE n=2 Tax=Hexamita inflata TaxID=28002 RepID=A0AA86PYZ5_9EUKA|nr:FeFe-hydrogenase assembly protein HydE [Hexamita inflata]
MLTYPTHSSLTEEIIQNYQVNKALTTAEICHLLSHKPKEEDQLLFQTSRNLTTQYVGDMVHVRAIIELSNICECDCDYCGIRKSNEIERFSLPTDQIIQTAIDAMKMYPGLLLQSGEVKSQAYVNKLVEIVKEIKKLALIHSSLKENFRVIMSVGELTASQFKQLRDAGAERYLLRIETSNPKLFKQIHDQDSSLAQRLQCLDEIKSLNQHLGTGVLIGIPNQTVYDLAKDIQFYKKIQADMIGMGPLIPTKGTPIGDTYNEKKVLLDLHSENLFDTVKRMIAVTRMIIPKANISATTAMEVLSPHSGRVEAIQVGSNVVMPVMTPVQDKKKYHLYDGKTIAKSGIDVLKQQIAEAGRKCDLTVAGDPLIWLERQK